jgi:hypothetical protein
VLPFVITADHRPAAVVDASHPLARGAQASTEQAALF